MLGITITSAPPRRKSALLSLACIRRKAISEISCIVLYSKLSFHISLGTGKMAECCQFRRVSLPSPRTFANSSPSNQPALLDQHLVPPFLDFLQLSLFSSCSPTEPYPVIHHCTTSL